VDRSPLRPDLMRHPGLRFVKGDAFTFKPDAPVDWLLCDVIATPARSVALLRDWLREKRMCRFVVTIKFKGPPDHTALDDLKTLLPITCGEFSLTRLCANKNEACAIGEVRS
jgi:23S rRNA (cytidine2498-2'-O)-methyltransferase